MAVKLWYSYIFWPTCLPRDDTYAFHFAAILLHEIAGHPSSLWWRNEGEGTKPPSASTSRCACLQWKRTVSQCRDPEGLRGLYLWNETHQQWHQKPDQESVLQRRFQKLCCCQHMWDSVPMGGVIQSQGLGVDERVGMPALQNATSSVVDVYTLRPPRLWVKTYLGISSDMGPQVQLAFIVIKMLFSILRSQTTRECCDEHK